MALSREELLSIAKDTIETLGYAAVELKLSSGKHQKTLKAVVTREEGVSMDGCAEISNVLLRRVELKDPEFGASYELVVESPGADRKLARFEEAPLFRGRKVRLVLKKPAEYGLKDSVVVGRLVNAADARLTLDVDGKEMVFPWDACATVRLNFDIKDYLK